MNIRDAKNIISPEAADQLIRMRDGDSALLYLYFCRHMSADRETACKDLLLPRQRLNEAYERLEMVGLLPLPVTGSEPAPPSVRQTLPVPESSELPEYSAKDVSLRSENDPAFSALISEAQLIIGRALSTPDLIKLLGIYDHLDLPAEVIMELMNFVADVYRDKYGERRRPSARSFELEAGKWAERGITDFDAAEQYIRQFWDHHSKEGAYKDALRVIDRDFTDTERRYVEQWLDWGFDSDAIDAAYDKTVSNTGKRSLAYMNKILLNWHDKGLHSLSEIREKDRPKFRQGPSSSSQTTQQKPDDIWDKVNQI